ncbi:hypothetical protein SI65_00732 [Aspergillus cristatus]|uniref:Uncharacterized protein n=1 Tax=Aspergillus cristatus TaxID=573508 RepID=A0A1E3BQ88_ASPCR|nr:hypothetical protein SI65_00732 [Aspergillus cristatus]
MVEDKNGNTLIVFEMKAAWSFEKFRENKLKGKEEEKFLAWKFGTKAVSHWRFPANSSKASWRAT